MAPSQIVRCIAVIMDDIGKGVYTGSKDSTVRVWDIESGKQINSVPVGSDVTSLLCAAGCARVCSLPASAPCLQRIPARICSLPASAPCPPCSLHGPLRHTPSRLLAPPAHALLCPARRSSQRGSLNRADLISQRWVGNYTNNRTNAIGTPGPAPALINPKP